MAPPTNLILRYTVDKHSNDSCISLPPNLKNSELKSAIRVYHEDGPLRELTTEIPISPHETVDECMKAMKLEHATIEEAKGKVCSTASDAASSWVSQKRELERARDEAIACADKRDKLVQRLLRENVSKREEYQAQESEIESLNNRVMNAAVIKKTSSISASPTTEELSKLHTQELKTLHAQVTALHKASLKAAADAATMAAKAEAAAASTKSMQVMTAASTKVAVDATPFFFFFFFFFLFCVLFFFSLSSCQSIAWRGTSG
ncbi:uncharacterized protein F5147DRAFT_768504 [Suillus discolor]|uniref:Uncharacterized protein n=1 Tax=Suillus discolor TaxID=1912936 RepID=A0A9P7FIL0_9AGAM|nr:uncharacterized protein F5147DRAFT_768504 [Suillus discolor]KAG2117125.1 hypothetical protein F5147DRAFT_768504 [Suillus discolor]